MYISFLEITTMNSTIPSKNNQEKEIETTKSVFTRLLIFAGLILFLVGVYFVISTADLFHKIFHYYESFIAPSSGNNTTVFIPGSMGIVKIIFYFVPALVLLAVSVFYSQKYKPVSYVVSVVIAFYFIIVQFKLLYDFYFKAYYYTDFTEASIYLYVSVAILAFACFVFKKQALVLLSIGYIYLTSFFYIMTFGGENYTVLFMGVFVYSVFIALLDREIRSSRINLINFVSFLGLFSFFFLRKFIINSKIEFLPVFFGFGTLFYMLFYSIPIFSTRKMYKPINRWIQATLTGLNLLFFLLTNAFIFQKFYSYTYLCLFITLMLLANLGGVYVIKKQAQSVWKLPYEYAVIFLAALLLPVWIQESKILLFMGVFSILMLRYSIREQGKNSFWISVVTIIFSVMGYFVDTLSIVPVMIYDHKTPEIYLLLKAILNSVFLLGLLWGSRLMVKDAILPVSEEIFKPRKYVKIIDASLLSFLFVTVGLIIFLIPYLITGSVRYFRLSWFISGSLFFIYFIRYFTGKKLALKKPTQYAAFVFALLYPILTTISFLKISPSKLISIDYTAIISHYSSLVLFIVLSVMAISRISKRNKTHTVTLRVMRLAIVLYLLFIAFEEYNNLSMLVSFITGQYAALESDSLFIVTNFYFPFTIILALYATAVNIYAIVKQDGFLRIVSIVLIVLAVAKLFILDKSTASEDSIGTIFILSGIFLVVLAILNSWLLNRISRR